MGGQMPSTTVARGRGAGLGKETPVHIRVDGGLWYTEADTQTDAHAFAHTGVLYDVIIMFP